MIESCFECGRQVLSTVNVKMTKMRNKFNQDHVHAPYQNSRVRVHLQKIKMGKAVLPKKTCAKKSKAMNQTKSHRRQTFTTKKIKTNHVNGHLWIQILLYSISLKEKIGAKKEKEAIRRTSFTAITSPPGKSSLKLERIPKKAIGNRLLLQTVAQCTHFQTINKISFSNKKELITHLTNESQTSYMESTSITTKSNLAGTATAMTKIVFIGTMTMIDAGSLFNFKTNGTIMRTCANSGQNVTNTKTAASHIIKMS